MRLFVKTLLVVAMTIAIVVPLTVIRATIGQRQRYCRRLSKASQAASRARSRVRGPCVIPGTRRLGLLQVLAGTNLPSLGVAMLQSRQGDGQPEAFAADGIDAVGVALVDPVNVYSKADRARARRAPLCPGSSSDGRPRRADGSNAPSAARCSASTVESRTFEKNTMFMKDIPPTLTKGPMSLPTQTTRATRPN